MVGFERQKLARYDQETFALKAALGILTPKAAFVPRSSLEIAKRVKDSTTTDHKTGIVLCGYVSAWRLIDAICLIKGRTIDSDVPTHEKQPYLSAMTKRVCLIGLIFSLAKPSLP